MLVQAGWQYSHSQELCQDCRFIFVQKELEILKLLALGRNQPYFETALLRGHPGNRAL